MKETTRKGRVYGSIHDHKYVVRIMDIVEHENLPEKTIVIVRRVRPLVKTTMGLNLLDFDLISGYKKVYMSLGEFEENFKWFIHDEESDIRLREGFYDI